MKRIFSFVLACAMTFSTACTTMSADAYNAQSAVSAASSEKRYYGNLRFDYKVLPDNTIAITGCEGGAGVIAIPSEIGGKTVTTIAKEAFKNYEYTHPDNGPAFDDDLEGYGIIKSLTLPNTLLYIEENAFAGCFSLESITLPESLISIASGAFAGCTHLTQINYPDTLTCIQPDTFRDTAFAANSMRYEIIDNNEAVITGYYGSDGVVNIPSHIGGMPVTAIKGNAFTNMENEEFNNAEKIISLTLPDTLQTIDESCGERPFECLYNCAEISIPENITILKASDFKNTAWYKNNHDDFLVIGDGILIKSSIDTDDIAVPEGVKVISDGVFKNKDIKSVSVPDSVRKIDSSAFENCKMLADVKLPDSITDIAYNAFDGTKYLDGFDDGFVIIGDGLLLAYTGSESVVTIPNTVKTIGNMAFFKNSDVKKIIIPDSVKTIIGSFSACENLEEVVIPDSVATLAGSVFADDKKLKKVVLPKEIERIPTHCFYGCSSLETIDIPETVKEIGSFSFYSCSKLKSMKLPQGLTQIDDEAFGYCKNLENINIPDSVLWIGFDAFYGCQSLTEMTIPDSVTVINRELFTNCKELQIVTIPKTVKAISKSAFTGCGKLTIFGCKNSYAEKFASKQSIPFKAIDADTPDTPDTPDNPNTPDIPKPTKTQYPGNIDGDEKITSADALKALRASIGLENLTKEQMYFADVDKDEKVTSADSLIILRYSVGLVDKNAVIGL